MASNNVSGNTRATRSRFSSPLTVAATESSGAPSSRVRAVSSSANGGGASTNGSEGQKQFMHRWLEPPVQVKASYQDAGLVRHGVVENMVPLGTLPKVGLFKKTAPPAAAAPERPLIRKIVVKQKTAATPTPAPAPPPPPSAPVEDETEDEAKTDVVEDQDEEKLGGLGKDEAATKEDDKARKTAASRRARRSVVSGETDDEEWARQSSTQKATGRRSASRASTEVQQSDSGAIAGPRAGSQKDFIAKVVDGAVDEALTHYRYPTAWALRTLFEENSSNQEFLDMIQKVFLQTANADTLEQFCILLQDRKREGKRHNQAFAYFNEQNHNFAPHPPRRAPFSNLVKFDVSALHLDQHRAKSQSQSQSQSQHQQPQELQQRLKQQKPKRKRPAKEKEIEPEPEPEPQLEAQPEPQPKQEADPEPELPPRKKRKAGKQPVNTATASSSSKMATTNGVNGKASTETPPRRRTMSRSISSTSSLSSARSLSPPGEPPQPQDDGEGEGFDETPSRSSPAARQPITTAKRRRSNAPRKSRNVSPSTATSTVSQSRSQSRSTAAAAKEQKKSAPSRRQSSPAAAEHSAADVEETPYEMPAVVDSPLFPNFNSKKGPLGADKAKFAELNIATKLGKLDENDPRQLLRLKAKKVTTNSHTPFPLSNIRDSPTLDEQPEEPAQPTTATPASASRLRSAAASSRQTPALREGRSTRASFKRTYDDLEDQSSPIAANFPGSEVASTTAGSRAGTPALRPAKRPRTGLRVKTSPVKRRNASAGIPRPSGERSSPVGNAMREDDNDDYCSSCGGNGELVCCDGCTRSFHFTCVDPVLSPDAMPVEWFCNICRVQRDPGALPSNGGAFASLLDKLAVKNSSAFRLPPVVRDRFEGVRTGVDGEYEEIVPVVKPATRKKKNDEDQAPDFFRTRDADGKIALCHSCDEVSTSNRPILPCSQCGIFWHMDCLDPPATYPPHPRSFRCPLHADELLAKIGESLGSSHKHRRIKDAPVIRPVFSRGYANNGWIEVDLDDSGDETGWRDVVTFGRTVRLSEKGIKLDFLSRVHAQREKSAAAAAAAATSKAATPAPPPTIPMERRSLKEQQAALNLTQLSRSSSIDNNGGDGGNDRISTLINVMLSSADPSAIALIGRANVTRLESGKLTHMDQQSLRAVLANAESIANHVKQLLGAAPATTDTTLQQSFNPNNTEEHINSAMDVDVDPTTKSPAAATSPATASDDDVPAMTQGEKTPALGDQSPAAPLPLQMEENVPSVPATPTKGGEGQGEELVVVEEEKELEGGQGGDV
ncbi:hypothetical protein N0V88_001721 [Collariella sp. IMI 366227]|nr:hypothetical protein N0V88_001721 [Collariella sp. IMI 366227]